MEWGLILRAIAALLLVVGLIFGVAWLARRLRWDQRWQGSTRATQRLQLLESLYLDAQHRLVLVRCDDQAHLLVLSAQSTQLIQTNLPLETHEKTTS